MSTYVNIEILHSLPFSNANRDDAGQPKTVRIGGTTRGRLSSQSLKRAARFDGVSAEKGFGIKDDSTGGQFFRTRHLKHLIVSELEDRGFSPEEYDSKIDGVFDKALGKKGKKDKEDPLDKVETLIVVTREEVGKIVDLVLSDEGISKENLNEILTTSGKRDIALWGRFFASSNEATLDGSAQVAHAFTTHAVRVEDDFFVGLDDAATLYSNHAGAGHPGDAFFLSGVFYKYANINLEETLLNMGNAKVESKNIVLSEEDPEKLLEDTQFAVSSFLRSFSLSVPQGKIRSTAHTTLPSYIRVTITEDRPVNGSVAFDNAVTGTDLMQESIKRLEDANSRMSIVFGEPKKEFVINLSDPEISLDETINKVNEEISTVVVKFHKTISS